MHFDRRTQAALEAVGLDREEIREAADRVTEAVRADADQIAAFFDGGGTVYSDMELAHSTASIHEHTVDHVDLYTHGAALRGYLRFDSWGVPIEGGRILNDDVIELTLGPTVDGRVRFAHNRDEL